MPPLSLQTCWASAQADSHTNSQADKLMPANAIVVGPRGFKSALQSLVNFLIDHKVRANIWLKLPKDDAWWTDIWQYGQQAVGCTIYALGKSDCVPVNASSENLAASLRAIAIEQDNDLKREYLCVAVADNFAGALLAVRVPADGSVASKRNLRLYTTISGATVSAVGKGLRQIVEQSIEQQSQMPASAEPPMSDSFLSSRSQSVSDALLASHAMLSQWNRYFPASLSDCKSWPLSEAYLAWQLQFQEELRSELAICRSVDKNNGNNIVQSLSTEFIAQAGQEMQAPLTTIKTALTLLGSPAVKLAQRQRYLAMITAQCDRQKSLIDSVIKLLKLQTTSASTTQPIQLADLIPGIVSTYQPIAEERGIMLAYTVPANLAPVSGVESELKEVLIHLINNGIQATPETGRVWVAAVPSDDRFIALTVTDSGAGMTKADTAKLFEAFYHRPAAHAQDSGVGLGLTLVQQLIQRIGGHVSAESEPDKGTTLKVLLPIYPTAGQTASTTTGQSRDPQRPDDSAEAVLTDSSSLFSNSMASV
ncbi:MAG: ATP-binding protein [Cyanobacteria bacterium P01_D01_bin.105]